MMFHLNVSDDNDDLRLRDGTDVDHNTFLYTAFHKAV